ncbi:MAG: serine/threonine-protein kinase [Thermoanaerobaculia bacterium]
MKSPALFETAFASYAVVDLIGEGGAGRVYRVRDEAGQTYALKCLDPEKVTTEKRKRFRNEIRFCERNDHPNVLTVQDHGVHRADGKACPFYVMPLYNGTLRGLLTKGLPPERALRYFAQMLDGVEAAHLKACWHRDLKPENVLFDSGADRLVVADFGIAHIGEDFLCTLVETADHARLANFQYAAPEQRVRGGKVDHRADVFSLGLILNEMFTGERPEGSGHKVIGAVAPDYAYLDDLVELMRRQNPADRPASIDEIKRALIGRKNEFVSRQRLEKLKGEVVPAFRGDDPLRDSPITLTGVDYQKGELIFQLSQPVSPEWVTCFREVTNVEYMGGYEPAEFRFDRNTAKVRLLRENDYQGVIDYCFKRFLLRANENYARYVEREEQRIEREARQALQAKVAEEEKRQRILKAIRI